MSQLDHDQKETIIREVDTYIYRVKASLLNHSWILIVGEIDIKSGNNYRVQCKEPEVKVQSRYYNTLRPNPTE